MLLRFDLGLVAVGLDLASSLVKCVLDVLGPVLLLNSITKLGFLSFKHKALKDGPSIYIHFPQWQKFCSK